MRKNLPALTLVEVMIVVGIFAVISVPSYIAFNVFRQRQALTASTENLEGIITRARIYAREAKGSKMWGVKNIDDRSYKLVTLAASVEETVAEYPLDSAVRFTSGNFVVWFNQVTGETAAPVDIDIMAGSGNGARVSVSKMGLVEVRKL